MRRVLIAALIVATAVWSAPIRPSAQQPTVVESPITPIAVQATDFVDLRIWDAFVTDGVRGGTLRRRSVTQDPALLSRTVERFDQFHQDVRIWGADIVRDSERGVPVSIFGVLSPELALSVDPSITLSVASEALSRAGGPEALLLTPPELVIIHLDTGAYRLAYAAAVSGSDDVFRAFIDAQTGVELMRYSEMQTQELVVGTGTGVLGDQKKLSVAPRAGTYVAYDQHRPPIIETFDLRSNLVRAKALERGSLLYALSDLASDSDNVWSDVSVVDAHVHVSWTYDYYFKRFGRNGLNNRNGPIDIVVNVVSQQGALSLPNADVSYALNASWCGVCGPNGGGRMFFGSGIPLAYTYYDQTYTYFSGALDIAAHELTHAVTEATSGLLYRNESGALNEAFSDMMGKSVEFFYHPVGGGVGQADYTIGKDVIRSGKAGVPNGIRSMANPGLYGHPDHYSRLVRGPGDNGGVHINSAIPNQAFYLAIEGGTNRTSGVNVQGVGGANREQIEKVFYRAFTLLMPASATFPTARSATVQAARDLYGAGGPVERAITQAWNAVGVPDPATLGGFTSTVSSLGVAAFTVTMGSTGRYQANLTWADPSIDLDLYLSTTGCSAVACLLDVSRNSDGNAETVSWPVRAGEQYRLWVDNFTRRPTSFAVQHFVSSVNSTALTGSPADVATLSAASVEGIVDRLLLDDIVKPPLVDLADLGQQWRARPRGIEVKQ
jgi:bacillolysin